MAATEIILTLVVAVAIVRLGTLKFAPQTYLTVLRRRMSHTGLYIEVLIETVVAAFLANIWVAGVVAAVGFGLIILDDMALPYLEREYS